MIGRCGWTGRGSHERVVHRVDAARRGSNSSPSSRRRMSPTDSSSRSSRSPKLAAEVDAEGVVLALEPGAADAEDRPAAARCGRASSRASPSGPGCGTCWRRPSARGGRALVTRGPRRRASSSPRGSAAPTARRSPSGGPRSRPSPSPPPRRATAASRNAGQESVCGQSWAPNLHVRHGRQSSRWSWTPVDPEQERHPRLASGTRRWSSRWGPRVVAVGQRDDVVPRPLDVVDDLVDHGRAARPSVAGRAWSMTGERARAARA